MTWDVDTCTICGENIHLRFEFQKRDHYFSQIPQNDEQREERDAHFTAAAAALQDKE